MIQITSSGTIKIESEMVKIFLGSHTTIFSLFYGQTFLLIGRDNYWKALCGLDDEILHVTLSILGVGGINFYYFYGFSLPRMTFFRSKK